MDLQRQTLNLSKREKQIHDQENNVLLSMIGAELSANRSKLDAYNIIYQETLADLKNTQKEPQYRKLGDMIQMQPSLRSEVYAKNTHKLEGLGADIAGRIVEFYTQLPEEPEYRNIEPDTDIAEVKALVESVLKNSNEISDFVIDLVEDIEKTLKISEAKAERSAQS